MSQVSNFAQELESRTLMSAAPLSTAVQLDRLHVRLDLLHFETQCVVGSIVLTLDNAALHRDHLAADTTEAPLVGQLRSDLTTMRQQLLADRLTEASNVLADESVIVTEQKQILLDKGNSSAETTDHQILLADRIQLQTDMVAGLDSRITTRENFCTTLFNDGQAIVNALPTDADATPKLTYDLNKTVTDLDTHLGKMTNDLTQIEAARTQLIADLTAMQT